MKFATLLTASITCGLAAAALPPPMLLECSVISDSTTDEVTYDFTVVGNSEDISGICGECQTTLLAAAAADKVVLESFECVATPSDALFSLEYNNTGTTPDQFGNPESLFAFQIGMQNCGVFGASCPLSPGE